jgi:metal-responsive CopG/Arc/MetJ family transcriptional regulator
VVVIYHIIICVYGVAKKVAISITIDGEILRELNAYLREIQSKEIKSGKSLSTRSSLIEQLVREGIRE